MSIIHDFKSIKRKLERQEQKAEFEEKNPAPAMYGWPYGLAAPFELPDLRGRVVAGVQHGSWCAAARLSSGSCESITLTTANLPCINVKI